MLRDTPSMETRRLGRTGHHSSIAILGAAAFWSATPDEAAAGLGLALDRGVNHLDIAPQYGDAEVRIGPLVPAVRERLFIGCKTQRRNPDGVRAELERSLERLGTDHFDLYQLHAVTSLEVLDERAGAAEAILRARDEGLVRFVGITGHDLGAPAAHLEALRRYDLDTVMFPVYPRVWGEPAYRSDAEALLGECASRDVGVMAIKAVARRPWQGARRKGSAWYEPFDEAAGIERGVRFALSTPGVHAFCTPGDAAILPLVLDAAEHTTPMSPSERADAIDQMAAEEVIFPLVEKAVS
jgi:aryl-alcohol dehydrogenase-like predicted oxidoreductase